MTVLLSSMGRRKQNCPQKTEGHEEPTNGKTSSEKTVKSPLISDPQLTSETMDFLRSSPLFNPSIFPSSLYAVQLAQLQAASLLTSQRPNTSGILKRKLEEKPDEKESQEALNLSRAFDSDSRPLDLSSGPYSNEGSSWNFHPSNSSFLESSSDPLDKMTEIVKSGGKSFQGLKHTAWQSQWIHKGPGSSKDIFKCVWCGKAFSSLSELTGHMRATKHFGSPPSPSFIPSEKQRDERQRDSISHPRKLVRGQDVWLGRGEQQTKDILKCMWCSSSFRSLTLLTTHMQETKHYTKVISQEQLVSWKSSTESSSFSNSNSLHHSILTCKVCDKSFSSLSELSEHMIKNEHGRDRGKSNSRVTTFGDSLLKRKKSLPVKKLLEIERARDEEETKKYNDDNPNDNPPDDNPSDDDDNKESSLLSFSSSEKSSLKSTTNSLFSPPFKSSESRGKKESKSILGSLEKMVASSHFGSTSIKSQESTSSPSSPSSRSSLSILQRLGIDETLDYSKPLLLRSKGLSYSEQSSPERFSKSPPEEEQLRPSSQSPKVLMETDSRGKNPLAALQTLCDKTERPLRSSVSGTQSETGAMLAFSWACNQAIVNDSLLKCPFCDTPFLSKGAYRHHLSKMHFVKETLMTETSSSAGKASDLEKEDTVTSKFQKYSQLAKQLSCSNTP